MTSEGKIFKAKLTPECEKEIKSRLEKLILANMKIVDDFHVIITEKSKYNPVSPIPFKCQTRMNDLEVSGNKLILNLRDYDRTLRITHYLFGDESDFTPSMVIGYIDSITYSEMSEIVQTLNFVSIEFNGIEF